MKKADLELRIKELELELSNLKSDDATAKSTTKSKPEESEDKFLTLASHISAYIAYVNADTLKYEFINDLYEKSFGIPKGKIIGSHIKDVIGETNYKFALKYIKEVKSGKAVSYENTFDMASGKRWIKVDYTPVFDGKSKVVGIALVSYDITELKQSEKSLQESEERFQLLFNKAPLGYQSLDIYGNIIDVNQQWLDTLGYTRAEVIGKWFGDFLSTTYQDGFRKRFPIFKAQGHIHSEFEMVHKNGNKLFIAFEGRIGYDVNGEFKQTHCILQDITERRKAEEEIRKSEEKLRSILDATPFPVALVDTQDNNIQYWSRSAGTLFGHTAPTADEWYQIAYPDEEYRRDVIARWSLFLEKARLSKEPMNTGEFRVTCRDGSVLICELYATFIEDNLVVTFNDITDRKRKDEKLKDSEIFLKETQAIANLGTYTMDISSGRWTSSEVLDKIFGIDPDYDKSVEGWASLIHPEWQKIMSDYFMNEVIGKKTRFDKDYKIIRQNDKIERWVHGIGNLKFDKNDQPITMVGTILDITERKQAESALKASEKEFRSLAESMPQIVWTTRADGWNTYFNQQWVDYTGLTLEESYGQGWIKPFHPDDQKMAWDAWGNAIHNNTEYSIECRLRCHDGTYHWWLIRGVQQIGDKGEIVKWFGTCTDIERIKNAEIAIENKFAEVESLNRKLQETNVELIKAKETAEVNAAFFKASMENSHAGIAIAEMPSGKLKYVNKAALMIRDKDYDEIVKDIDIEKYVASWQILHFDGTPYQSDEVPLARAILYGETNSREFIVRRDNNEDRYIWANAAPIHDEKGTQIAAIVIFLDITDKKLIEFDVRKAKETAEENELKFRNLFENSPIGKSMTGIDGSLHLNKSFCDILGYSKDELRGKNFAEITHPEDLQKSNEITQSLINGKAEKANFEKRYIHKNGNILWIDVTTYLQRDKDNKPQFFITTIIDITERKNYESELVKAKEKAEESDRLKSAFLANMSHEIRTPMNGILGFTELLKEPNLSTDDQQDFIQTIEISGARMLNTINNIVDVSKIESGLIEVVMDETNLNKKIEFTYKFFKPEVEKKGLQFTFKNGLQTEDAVIRTDNEKVYGVLTNLLKNAIKFTYDGSIEFGYEKKDTFLEFYVKDTGVGIPKNLHQSIFERFRQGSNELNRMYEGSGLGLSIAKSYIEMLGGKIWVESEEGRGSTFYFTIPYYSVDEVKTEIKDVDSSEIKKVQSKNLKILIVEDDEVSYSFLKRTMQKIGKEILHAITGIEAIEACRSNPDLDLVLMDIRMPIMDGCEATRQIRQFNKDVIIIAQTAYAFAGDSEIAKYAGCNDYISKPINMTLLFELIKKHVKK